MTSTLPVPDSAARRSSSQPSANASPTPSMNHSFPSAPGPAQASRLSNQPALIEYQQLRFLVMDAPSDASLPLYIQELQKHGVTDIVRVCRPTYDTAPLQRLNIQVHDWPFDDGEPPPSSVIESWLHLVEQRFPTLKQDAPSPISSRCIATHCVAGLGRAPVLVAIALIEQGMAPLDSVAYIRERRRGAINNKQLKFLETYKRRRHRVKCRLM